MKKIAKNIPGNLIRCFMLRLAGYKIGREVYIGEDLIIIDELKDKERVSIGARAAIAERVTLVISSWPNNSRIRPYVTNIHGKISIGDDAWLGTGCIILPNVIVGKGSVVAAGSVVNKDVPDYVVVAGIPAQPLKRITTDNTLHELTKLY